LLFFLCFGNGAYVLEMELMFWVAFGRFFEGNDLFEEND